MEFANNPRYVAVNEIANQFVDDNPELPTVVTDDMMETAQHVYEEFKYLSDEAEPGSDMAKICAIRAFVFAGFIGMMKKVRSEADDGEDIIVDKL